IFQIPQDTLRVPQPAINAVVGVQTETATMASLPQQMILAIQFYERVKKEADENGLSTDFKALKKMIKEQLED
ncbi:MAG: hypothetical protein N4Q15_02880, partial [Lactobacillus crispatus]|nr:hypothetical protein [Lactobacillus crispatus]